MTDNQTAGTHTRKVKKLDAHATLVKVYDILYPATVPFVSARRLATAIHQADMLLNRYFAAHGTGPSDQVLDAVREVIGEES